MKGHKAADCWEKEENASKRPSEWKSKKNTELGGSAIEYCLVC